MEWDRLGGHRDDFPMSGIYGRGKEWFSSGGVPTGQGVRDRVDDGMIGFRQNISL